MLIDRNLPMALNGPNTILCLYIAMVIWWHFLNAINFTSERFWVVYSGLILTDSIASVFVLTLRGTKHSDNNHNLLEENNHHTVDDHNGEAANVQTAMKVTLIARPLCSPVGRTIAFIFNRNLKHYKFVYDKEEHGFNTHGVEDIVENTLEDRCEVVWEGTTTKSVTEAKADIDLIKKIYGNVYYWKGRNCIEFCNDVIAMLCDYELPNDVLLVVYKTGKRLYIAATVFLDFIYYILPTIFCRHNKCDYQNGHGLINELLELMGQRVPEVLSSDTLYLKMFFFFGVAACQMYYAYTIGVKLYEDKSSISRTVNFFAIEKLILLSYFIIISPEVIGLRDVLISVSTMVLITVILILGFKMLQPYILVRDDFVRDPIGGPKMVERWGQMMIRIDFSPLLSRRQGRTS